MILSRRSLFIGTAAILTAPAIVRMASILPVTAWDRSAYWDGTQWTASPRFWHIDGTRIVARSNPSWSLNNAGAQPVRLHHRIC